ncbi:uncharacterized protein Z520_07543 [Fonsecaea multimorphosa CBS 102226]|uniref:Enoyl reductase (ER) domain-containing protein n=1 Tax=Fonsecaea multimorphosa CBS 102226 TaxID=1442371 RepID=A0A0D2KJS5_9EURO|nr:uncharacterized protein Z520_07543 [Fonsecaea multimorphosa CBS 102226]KIX96823.1 hypothetical protein Z520_07543 [Fonsecaea multimorphosa CBS 102226]OAL22503.1 hypothetical protein AYO22_07061 [Fonsecaea multimorphosa]
MSLSPQNFGLVREGIGCAVLKPIPVPKLKSDYILVRTVAVALNPTDWTSLDAVGQDGTIVGCDYSGIVVTVGELMKDRFKKGDRVAGFGHGANDFNPENGAFAKYIAVKGALQMHIPESVSFEAASTVGVGVHTVGFGLYKSLELYPPGEGKNVDADNILIYGGSTATGTIAIQFARLSGLNVITTCSPKHFEMVKALGASQAYDYHVPDVGRQIYAATNGKLKIVFDTVATEATAQICADAFGDAGGVYCNLLNVDCPHPKVRSEFFLGYSLSGEPFIYEGEFFDAQPDDLAFGSAFARVAERLWREGKWKPHPQRVERGGLLGVVDGLQQMIEGKVSGEKLVYLIEETEWP